MFSEKQFINYHLRLRRIRRSIVYSVTVLVFFGILFVYNVSSVHAWRHYSDPMYFLKRHIFFIALGIVSLLGVLAINLDSLRKYSKGMLMMSIIVLLAVLYFGQIGGGARRWLRIFSWTIQPSEFAKIFFILYISDYISRKNHILLDFIKGVFPLIIVTVCLSGTIFLEPDLGNAVFFGLLLVVYLFVNGISKDNLAKIVVPAIVLITVLIAVSPYRMARILTYFNPWLDAKGRGFQLVQSQIALGSGGLLGLGLGESSQKLFFLPAAHTDFIYSIIGEELGFLGCIGILFIYLFIFFQSLRLLSLSGVDRFRFNIGFGVAAVFTLEALINMGVAVGVLPTKGLPLPFISYGGSSTVANFIMLGLFLKSTKIN